MKRPNTASRRKLSVMMDQMVFLDDAAGAVNSIAGGTSPFSFFYITRKPRCQMRHPWTAKTGPVCLESLGNKMQRNANDSPSTRSPEPIIPRSTRPRGKQILDALTLIPDLDKSNEKAKGVNNNANER